MSENIVLVTGGAGYIGAHACKSLKLHGYFPVVYDNLIYGHKDFVKWGPLVVGDLLDKNKLVEVFSKFKPIIVLHFAGFGYVGESTINPAKYYENNVAGTISLLDAMRTSGVKKIVFSSSCATFGIPKIIPISEKNVQEPINPYGRSKLFIEKILKDYDAAYGIKYAILRYFNAAGADPDCDIGEDHSPEFHLIPLMLDVALGRRKEIVIFGDDYETNDGTCIRDYIHVTDLAEAHVQALEYLNKYEKSDEFNLGIGKGFSVNQILNTVEKICGCTITKTISSRRIGDPPILVANPDKAIHKLNLSIRYNEIDEIILHAWQWHKKRFG